LVVPDGEPVGVNEAVSPPSGGVSIPVEVVPASMSPTPDVALPIERGVAVNNPDWNILDEEVSHSLARTFAKAEPKNGAALSAVYSRLFHWDIDLRRDLRKGDRVVVAWKVGDHGVEIAAALLTSGKLGRTLSAYRFKRGSDAFPSFWERDGSEIARRLKESPLADYEMVTSLLKDRPSHAGMDFKTPEGTAIIATRAGTITRTNWNTRANGNCVELKFSDGTLAKYLHLSKTGVKPGQRVSAGGVLGASGNTGRSTAPHLHYQLNKGRRVLDPVTIHGTVKRSIHTGERDAFRSDVARLDALLGNALARR
jgi:murein DD-endopeptidase MepM/ murein hydrolase activator NlpD